MKFLNLIRVFSLCCSLIVCSEYLSQSQSATITGKDGYVEAPFKKLDKYSTNDWWNRKDNEIIDLKVNRADVIAFALYTLSNGTLKLTAQLFPLYPDETREVRLEEPLVGESGFVASRVLKLQGSLHPEVSLLCATATLQ